MAPFQFIVIAVLVVIALLLGALVIFASVLTSRIRRTNAALRRIEEALISSGSLRVSANARATEAAQTPEVSGKESEATRYLTIRDLKNKNEPRSSRVAARTGKHSVPLRPESRAVSRQEIGASVPPPAHSENAPPVAAIAENHDAPSGKNIEVSRESLDGANTSSERSPALGEHVDGVNVFAEISEKSAELNTDDQQAGVLASRPENEIIAASLELISPNNTSEQPPMSSASSPVSGDSLQKKDRDALLIMLSNQRRRRRARQGY